MLNTYNGKRKKSIQVAIGEDGVVAILCENGIALTKLFIPSSDETETEKLRVLLQKNPQVPVYIYLDNIDQSYIQRTLPGVASFSIAKIAQTRLEREIPKNHLKGCVQLSRHNTGRKDWIYTFISTPLEPPISTWIDYFVAHQNVIKGLYFYPIEIYSVIQKIKSIQNKIEGVSLKQKILNKIRRKSNLKKPSKLSRWEIFISHNKTGGFRQIAYQDGNIVFSRLLNNISSPNSEVIAGNIELELINSIEYLSRLSIAENEQVDIYLILTNDIIKCIRNEKIKANIYSYSPFELANLLNLKECTSEKDRFSDPTLLTALSKSFQKKLTLHTAATYLINKYTSYVNIIADMLVFVFPILIIMTTYLLLDLGNIKFSLYSLEKFIAQLNNQMVDTRRIYDSIGNKLDNNMNIQHMADLVNMYGDISENLISPYEFFEELAKFLPSYARVTNFKWECTNPWILSIKPLDPKDVKPVKPVQPALPSTPISTHKVELEIQMTVKVESFEELQRAYDNFCRNIKINLKEYNIVISELPQLFNLEDINVDKVVNLEVKAYKMPSTFKSLNR